MKLKFSTAIRTGVLALAVPSCGLAAASPALTLTGTRELDGSPFSVELTYTLEDAPGIVLFDVLTNGVSIGGANIQRVSGDVNRLVQPGGNRVVRWFPAHDWPGRQTGAGEVTYRLTALPKDHPPLYMVVDLCVRSNITYYADADFLPFGGIASDVYKADRLAMRRIDAKGITWQMGTATNSPANPNNANDRLYQFPREMKHDVTLTNNYYIGIYEVTQQQWWNIARGWTGLFTDERTYRPVENIGFNHIRGNGYYWPAEPKSDSFLGKARAFTGLALDLPSESQWEYAARAGSAAAYCNGLDCLTAADAVDANLSLIGWYRRDDWQPHPVGQRASNSWGLYDVCGSIWEWCRDWVGTGSVTPYGTEDVTDPPGLATGTVRSRRGGSFDNVPWAARCAFRTLNTPDTANGSIAFRLYLPVSEVVGK